MPQTGRMSAENLYLASRSERRQQLLRQIGVDFTCRAADIDETRLENEQAAAYVERLARAKASDVAGSINQANAAVLAADTAVVLGGQILGKPGGFENAREMLCALSGKKHDVFTAVAVCRDGKMQARLSISEVRMKRLGDALIERYWQSGEPAGKAGAYAIQGYAGGFITSLTGSYSGVMGLPLCETVELLQQAGIGWALQAGRAEHA